MAQGFYNWADDPAEAASAPPPVLERYAPGGGVSAQPTTDPNLWDPTGYQRRRELALRHAQAMASVPLDEVNLVTGHALDCQCPRCPLGAQVARQQVAAVAPARAPRPLQDQVVPVSILLVVFTICSIVLLPVVMPFVALGSMSLGLVAVSLVAVAACALGTLRFVGKLGRGGRDQGGVRVVRGEVVPPWDE